MQWELCNGSVQSHRRVGSFGLLGAQLCHGYLILLASCMVHRHFLKVATATCRLHGGSELEAEAALYYLIFL